MSNVAYASPTTDRMSFGQVVMGLLMLAGILLVIAAFTNTIYQKYFNEPAPVKFTTTSYMRAMGLEPGKEYPLSLGSTINGTSGTTTRSFGVSFFFASSTTQTTIAPASSVMVGFTSTSGSRYIFSVPYANIKFFQLGTSGVSTAKFVTKDSLVETKPQYRHEDSHGNITWTKPTIYQSESWSSIQAMGLAQYLQQNLVRLQLQVPDSVYNSLLGSQTG